MPPGQPPIPVPARDDGGDVLAPAEVRPGVNGTALFSASPRVRLAFGLLERVAPVLGAWWACRLWMTLPRPRARKAPAEPGAPFALDVAGGRVTGRTWGEGPPVYLVHGWAGHGDQFEHFVAPLVGRGFRVVAHDAPSHGRSAPGRHGPRSSSIPEFAETLTAVAAVHGVPHAVVAHSLGAAAAAAAVAGGLAPGRLVLLAPMAGPRAHAQDLAVMLGFGERTLRRLIRVAERRVGAPTNDYDVPALGRAGAMPPTLLVHDRGDRSTSPDHARAIAAAWPGSELRLTEGLGHTRLLRDADVVARVVDFVVG